MGLTKAIKDKLNEQQGYQPVETDDVGTIPSASPRPLTRREEILKKHELGVFTTGFFVFLIGILFWSCCASIALNALIMVYPNPSGNPRAAPILSFCVSGLGIITSFVTTVWLCKRASIITFLLFLVLSCLTSMYFISSATLLGLTFTGHINDCPHQYTVTYAYKAHQGWTFTCDAFSLPMYLFVVAAISFDSIGFVAIVSLLILIIRFQIPLFVDLLDEYYAPSAPESDESEVKTTAPVSVQVEV